MIPDLEQALIGGCLLLVPLLCFLMARDRYEHRKEIEFLHERERNIVANHRHEIDIAHARADQQLEYIRKNTMAIQAMLKVVNKRKE